MNNDAAHELNSVQYLFLRELSEPRDNSLRLVVEEAVKNELGVPRLQPTPELQKLLENAHPIESIEGCRKFELYWRRYVAYLVTEELVGSNAIQGYNDEAYTGTVFRIYSKSHFLDHIVRDTGGHVDEVHHYRLVCLNHLIDVAAYLPPDIHILDSHEREEPDLQIC